MAQVVEQRLEEVVVRPVDERHAATRLKPLRFRDAPLERLGEWKNPTRPASPASDDVDVRPDEES